MSNNQIDVALWGPSIRTELWINQLTNLKKTNKCKFKIFYCGQIKPKFILP